jgi:nucleotide-binding universal stress UspA family protein
MFKRILLTVDLSHPASWKAALPMAVDLARLGGGELHVMTVVPTLASAMVASYFPPDFEKHAMEDAKAALAELVAAEVPKGQPATVHVAHGTVYDEVLKQIDETGADLVIMASHAPDRVREFLVGSQADRVVRRSPVSVLVVRG